MGNVACSFNYVYFQGGSGHSRRPRSNPPAGGLLPVPLANLSYTAGLPEGVPISTAAFDAPAQLQDGQDVVNYVFLSIAGAQSGNQTWIVPAGYPLSLTQLQAAIGNVVPGANPVTINFVYGPPVGSGPPPPPTDSGASIDCYFAGTASLVDNVFVSVSPDNGATAIANNDGWVDTWTTAETITADFYISPDGVDPNEVSAVFDRWINMLNPMDTSAFSGDVLNAAEKGNYYALALYRVDPCQSWRTLIANFNISDYPNEAAADKALIALRQNLLTCERENGELPPLPPVRLPVHGV
jgi:hypothetical protein